MVLRHPPDLELVYVGARRALDPDTWFVVVVNQIGNGLSTSPHNTDGAVAMSKFPLGAQQTYEWAVRFPDKVLRAAPIAGTARNTPHDFLFTQSLMDAITSDPGWNGGEYASHKDDDVGLCRACGHLVGRGPVHGVLAVRVLAWHRGPRPHVHVDGRLPDVFVEAVFTEMDPNASW